MLVTGRVYRAHATQDPTKVLAVKKMHVTDHVKHPRLSEVIVRSLCSCHKSIPLVYAWGKSQFYEYLAMESLSVDLLGIDSTVTMRNLVVLALQLLDGLEHVHSRGIVHCDIKPGNLMLGSDAAEPGRVRFIDFGLCRPYRDLDTSEHLPDKGISHFVGTRLFISLNGHLHHSPSRTGDMEALSYTLLALVVSRLPWESRLQLRLSSRRLFDLKKQWSGALLEGELSLLGDFIDYTRSLAYSEEPDYARWRHRFRYLVPELPDDPLYEAADCSGPTLVANGENLPRGPGDPMTSGSWPDPSGSGGDWIPTSTWDPAVPLEEDELLGDESMIVTERIDVIDEVPKTHKNIYHPTVLLSSCARHQSARIPWKLRTSSRPVRRTRRTSGLMDTVWLSISYLCS
ncbi:kinase-like protein [Polyporus arcularius HHB13444]|uniref:non-specific serine/threonine protein kinase n=1 Tax=Polyporus arcularius HHB13444 TaxID=1314778 RepID=A0A5C3NVV4_9APHY|nr:kinase-like protein [Polyporus arcularius HHB13444]